MNCNHKTFNVFISPIKAIMYEIDDPSVDYILPNHYIFQLQCAALGVDIRDEEISMRKKLNDGALHDAIQSSYAGNS